MNRTDLLNTVATAMRLRQEVGEIGFKLMAYLREFDDFSQDFTAISQEVHTYHALSESLQKATFNNLITLSRLAELEGEF